ncbi:DUF1870 family protein [Salmonella enterica]|nr:DUF1870 family protein [Salmonella enterica]
MPHVVRRGIYYFITFTRCSLVVSSNEYTLVLLFRYIVPARLIKIVGCNEGTMNNLELLACRKLLFLEVNEAAKLIGNVEARTWRYYESGRSSIPEVIQSKMQGLLQRRTSLLEQMRVEAAEYRKQGNGRQVVPFFTSFEQFQQETGLPDLLEWRIDMSVKSSLYLEDAIVLY